MDAIEKAIRNALEKGDATDGAFRQRVYRSAHAALERAFRDRDSISPEMMESRRARLRTKIAEIELEFLPALAEQAREHFTGEPGIEPGDRLVSGRWDEDAPQPRARKRRRPRRGLAYVFIAALLVATVGIGAWWTVQTGLLLSPADRDTSVPNPPATLDSEDFAADGPGSIGSGGERQWIIVFDPASSSDLTVPSGASAEIIEEEGRSFLRIHSNGAAEITFDIGQGTLEGLAGKPVMFSILARAPEEGTAQISVSCDLAGLGGCGRKRYEVGPSLGEFLFEVELAKGKPVSAGRISINPDIERTGSAVDIREIRVSPAS